MAPLGPGGLGFRLYPALAEKSQGIPSFGRCFLFNFSKTIDHITINTTVVRNTQTDKKDCGFFGVPAWRLM